MQPTLFYTSHWGSVLFFPQYLFFWVFLFRWWLVFKSFVVTNPLNILLLISYNPVLWLQCNSFVFPYFSRNFLSLYQLIHYSYWLFKRLIKFILEFLSADGNISVICVCFCWLISLWLWATSSCLFEFFVISDYI